MVLRFDRQYLLDELIGLLWMGSHNAGEEAKKDGGRVGIPQRAKLTESAYRDGHVGEIRLCPIAVDPAQHRIRRIEIGLASRKSRCRFCTEDGCLRPALVDYKDVELLRKMCTGMGKVLSRKRTGSCAAVQRAVADAVKRARFMGLLPYVGDGHGSSARPR